jgi:hypothetical protein
MNTKPLTTVRGFVFCANVTKPSNKFRHIFVFEFSENSLTFLLIYGRLYTQKGTHVLV